MTERIPLTPEILVPRLGEVLVDNGLITRDQLQIALDRQSELRQKDILLPFGQVLVEIGFIDRPTLDQAITEQILALRAALQSANRNLELRVEQRTAELQEALRKLSELNQLKANFVSNISHELRTPLTHIKGYIELLVSKELGATNIDQEHALQVMQKATERLERLIEDLIMFSTAERGDIQIQPFAFNLATLGYVIVKRALPKATEKKIDVQLVTDTNDLMVFADEDKIAWVLMQLLDNAIKFTPPQKPVKIVMTREDLLVRVAVVDKGIGMPKERLEEIFEPFHQLDGSSTRRYGGTGLGLALARRIIEAHDSTIQVSSTVGEGSKFEFLLKRPWVAEKRAQEEYEK